MLIYRDPNIAVWQILHLYSASTQSINRALAHMLPRNTHPHPTCTCTRTSHTPPPSLDTRSSVKLKAGWLEQQDLLRSAFAINILLFQMVPPITREAPATGPADRKGWGMADRTKWLKSLTFPRRWEARWQNAPLFDCYYRYVAILLQFSPHQCVYWSISAFVAKDIYHIRLKPFKSYLSVYIHLALKKRREKSIHGTAEWFGFLNPPKLCANLIKAHTCHYTNAHVQTAPVGDCLNRWHFEPYYTLTTRHGTQQTSRQISLLFLSLPPLPPHCHSPSSFIQFGVEDAGWGGGLCSKQGRGGGIITS